MLRKLGYTGSPLWSSVGKLWFSSPHSYFLTLPGHQNPVTTSFPVCSLPHLRSVVRGGICVSRIPTATTNAWGNRLTEKERSSFHPVVLEVLFYSGLALLLWAYGGSIGLTGNKVEQNCLPRGQGGRKGKKRPSPWLEGKSFPVESCFCLSSAGDRLAHRARGRRKGS